MMDSLNKTEVLSLIDILNTGAEGRQEEGLKKFNTFIEKPAEFFEILSEIVATTTTKIVKFQALRLMEQTVRLKIASFSEEEVHKFREICLKSLDFLSLEDYKYAAPVAMRLNKGSDEEWRVYNQKHHDLPPKEEIELSLQIYNHLEIDILYQPIVEDTKFAFDSAEEFLASDQALAKVLYLKFINMYLVAYKNQTEELIPYYDGVLTIARDSLKYGLATHIQIWHNIAMILKTTSTEIPIFEEITSIAQEYGTNEELRPTERYYPLMIYESVSGEISFEEAIAAADIAISLFTTGIDEVSIRPELLLFFIGSLFEAYEHENVSDYIIGKLDELAEIDTRNSKATGLILFHALLQNYSPWFIAHIDKFNDAITNWVEPGDPFLSSIFCKLVLDFPHYFGYDICNLGRMIKICTNLLTSELPSLSCTAVFTLNSLLKTAKSSTKDITFPIIELAENISDDIIGNYLFSIANAMKLEADFTNEEIFSIAEFAVPLLADDEPDTVNGGIRICIEAMCLNDEIQEELCEPVFAAITRILESSLDYVHVNGVEFLQEIQQVFPEQVAELTTQYRELIYQLIDSEEAANVNSRQRAFAAAVKIIPTEDTEFVSFLFEKASSWFESEDPSSIVTAADILLLSSRISDEATLSMCERIAGIIEATEFEKVALILTTKLGSCVKKSRGELFAAISQIGRRIVNEYIDGSLAILNSVPPESTDLNYEFLLEMSKLCAASIAQAGDELQGYFRFYNSLLERYKQQPLERFLSTVIYFWQNVLVKNLETPETTKYIFDNVMSMFTPDAPKVIYRTLSKVITVLIYKKKFAREDFMTKLDVVETWVGFCIENEGMMRNSTMPVFYMLWVATSTFGLEKELSDLVKVSMEHSWSDRSLLSGMGLSSEPLFMSPVPSHDEEIKKEMIIKFCKFLERSRIRRLRTVKNPENEQNMISIVKGIISSDEALKAAVREFAAQNSCEEKMAPLLE